MASTGDFEAVLMSMEGNDQDMLAGMQLGSQRSTHMADGSMVSPTPSIEATSLEAPGIETRLDRLLRIKAAIECGQYYVSAHDIADRVMIRMLVD